MTTDPRDLDVARELQRRLAELGAYLEDEALPALRRLHAEAATTDDPSWGYTLDLLEGVQAGGVAGACKRASAELRVLLLI